MKDLTEIKKEAVLEEKFRSLSFSEKVFLSRKLIREGFIKNGPLLYAWWLHEKRSWVLYSRALEQAMDEYIETHPNMIYLEDFNAQFLTDYPGVGKAKIKELERRINLYLNSIKDDNK